MKRRYGLVVVVAALMLSAAVPATGKATTTEFTATSTNGPVFPDALAALAAAKTANGWLVVKDLPLISTDFRLTGVGTADATYTASIFAKFDPFLTHGNWHGSGAITGLDRGDGPVVNCAGSMHGVRVGDLSGWVETGHGTMQCSDASVMKFEFEFTDVDTFFDPISGLPVFWAVDYTGSFLDPKG